MLNAWLAVVAFAAGLILVTAILVANAIEAGAVLHVGASIDPTRMGSGGKSAQVLYGPIARVLTASFLLAAATTTLSAGSIPAWTEWLAVAVRAFHLDLAGQRGSRHIRHRVGPPSGRVNSPWLT